MLIEICLFYWYYIDFISPNGALKSEFRGVYLAGIEKSKFVDMR